LRLNYTNVITSDLLVVYLLAFCRFSAKKVILYNRKNSWLLA